MARPQPSRTIRSALMRCEMEGVRGHEPVPRSSPDAGPLPFRLRFRPGIALPHPARHTKDRQPQRTATHQTPAARLLRRQHLSIGFDGFATCHFRRTRPRTTLGNRNPTGEKRERLRRARRTLLRVMHLLAIEAHTGGTELHTDQCTRLQRAGYSLRTTTQGVLIS
jgi:hypothetical protein